MSLSDPDHRADVERKLTDPEAQAMATKMGNVNEADYEWSQNALTYREITDFTFRLPRNPVVPGSLRIVGRAGPNPGQETYEVLADDAGNLHGHVGQPGGGITNCVRHLDGEVSVRFLYPVRWLKATYKYRDDLRGTYV